MALILILAFIIFWLTNFQIFINILLAAFVIGLVAGWVYLAASALILRLKIDDAVDAIPVHLFGGELYFGPI